ncbi:MAG: hypothetical protein ACE5ET_06155, partial [Gammaproteobacteria bacterium]
MPDSARNARGTSPVTYRRQCPAQGAIDLLALHERLPQRYPCLLESVVHGTPQARYDILFAFPGETLRLDAALELSGGPARGGDFLAAFDH